MSQCGPTWSTNIFKKAQRPSVSSKFRGPDSHDVPSWAREPGSPGRSDFLMWAQLPRMTYSADPDKLYDFQKLRTLLENSECYVQDVVERERSSPVLYPKSFYVGLALAGGAVLFSVFRKV